MLKQLLTAPLNTSHGKTLAKMAHQLLMLLPDT